MFCFEIRDFQLYDHIAVQFQMIKQQVGIYSIFAYLQWNLPSDKRKACTQFHQEACDILSKPLLQLSLSILAIKR